MLDRRAIDELWGYTDFAWDAWTGALGGDNRLLARDAPGSGWPALRDAFGHVLLSYDDWLAEVTAKPMTGVEVADLDTIAAVQSYRKDIRAGWRTLLDSLSENELHHRRRVMIDDEPCMYSTGDILANLLLHERGHHGDFSTLFYQLGLEIPMVDYRFYLLSQ